MSTPLLDPFRFANLRDSLQYHAPINSMLGSCLCSAIDRPLLHTSFDEKDARIAELVFDWQRANHDAHFVRYADHNEDERKHSAQNKPRPRLPRGEVLPVPALLKACEALRYNCDGGTASGEAVNKSLAVLDAVIDALKDACLEMLPEYQNAEWAI